MNIPTHFIKHTRNLKVRGGDEMKNYKCEINGVTLIRIKYDVQNLKEHKV